MCSQSIYIIVILWVYDTEEHVSQALFSYLSTKHMAHSGMNLYSVGHIYLLTCGVGRQCLYFPSSVITKSKRTCRVICKGYFERLLPCLQSFHTFRIIGPPFYIKLELRGASTRRSVRVRETQSQ